MKKLLPIMALFALATGFVSAETPSRVFSRPEVPSEEALSRLNLQLAWKNFLPVDGTRDGLATVQIFGDQMLVQLRSGGIIALDAETGQKQWHTWVSPSYHVSQGLGVNYNTVFGFNGSRLFALQRSTGKILWDYDLPQGPTAAPVADPERVFVCLSGAQLLVFLLPAADPNAPVTAPVFGPQKQLPPPAAPASPPPPPPPPPPSMVGPTSAIGSRYATESSMTSPLGGRTSSKQISSLGPLTTATQAVRQLNTQMKLPLAWSHTAESRMGLTPLLVPAKPETMGTILLAGERGNIFAFSKPQHSFLYHFQTEAPVSAPLGQFGDIAYIAFQDSNLIAMHIDTGRILWRIPTARPSSRRPEATEEDIYIAPERAGLYRFHRANGEAVWSNPSPNADRFLAASKKLVYALDRQGNLLILDRGRGTQLTSFDTRDFVVPISNEYSDRIYLAANDGLLVCLRDRDLKAPIQNKTWVDERPFERHRKGGDKPGEGGEKKEK